MSHLKSEISDFEFLTLDHPMLEIIFSAHKNTFVWHYKI